MHGLGRYLTGSLVLVSALASAGNERGGGTAPRPVQMKADALYSCEVEYVQQNEDMDRPLVSTTTQVLGWKKGEDFGYRGIDLQDMKPWKHVELKSKGPFAPERIELKEAPKSAVFDGFIALSPGKRLTGVWEIELKARTSKEDPKTLSSHNSESVVFERLDSKESFSVNVKHQVDRTDGAVTDSRTLTVSCVKQ